MNKGINTINTDVYIALDASNTIGMNYLIVDITKFNVLINLIPSDILANFINLNQQQIPDVRTVHFRTWVKNTRIKLSLTQSELAKKITQQGELRFYGSDLGNLETNSRLQNYTEARLEKLKFALLKILSEQTTNQNKS